jgi:carbon storage regulator CsrA
MLVLSRKRHESVVVGRPGSPEQVLTVTVLGFIGESVRLGFEAADDVAVHRWEIWQRIHAADHRDSAEKTPRALAVQESEPGPNESLGR